MNSNSPDTVVRGDLPADTYLSAMQVVNWIALGHPWPEEENLSSYFVGKWDFLPDPDRDLRRQPTLAALEEMNGGPPIWVPSDEAVHVNMRGEEPRWVLHARQRAREIAEQYSEPLPTLIVRLAVDIELYQNRQQLLHRAEDTILAAVRGEKLTMLATPLDISGHPVGLPEPVPSFRFASSAVRIARRGVISHQGQSTYGDVHFKTSEVATLWPPGDLRSSPPEAAEPTPTASPRPSDARVHDHIRAFLRQAREGGQEPSRSEVEQEAKLIHARDRQIESALRALPSGEGLRPGRPRQAG
ncbi:hypothetical protein M0638_20480 [Roseomonas sp. NAR14]|uniref:Uncharacterized protein n=1 Tax=Roseomonas acroporae TaxID=2937791 RepID=A0A9X1YDK6_9PROT|nr:hypothetical protein [Roseomonas acroporae]MCK8786752.1 hypothetical protein [Roseomonas acroporae]